MLAAISGLPRPARPCIAGLLGLLAFGGCAAEPEGEVAPNLVVIIADDHGYPDFGFTGSRFARTPELDRLAAGGTVFRTAYAAASVCAPSLRAMLTGLELDQWHQGLSELAERGVVRAPGARIQDFGTLPRWLAERGYSSMQAGKFWRDSFALAGFSDGTKSANPGDPPFVRRAGGSAGLAVGRQTMQPVYDFIDAHSDGPFLLWFAPELPHAPFDAPERFRKAYSDLDLSPATRAYYANISRLDEAVGGLLRHLERRGLRRRTLVVFCSDNGWHDDPDGPYSLRGGPKGKFSMYELGFRTPLVFSWPGVVPDGAVRDDLVSLLDLAPTLLAFAGVDPLPPQLLGRNLVPALLEAEPVGRERLYGHMRSVALHHATRPSPGQERPRKGEASFLRGRRWHYVWYPGPGDDLLFDLRVDPMEDHNLVSDHPEVVARFRRDIAAWRRSLREEAPSGILPGLEHAARAH